MAKYDQGGGCNCGLYKTCTCKKDPDAAEKNKSEYTIGVSSAYKEKPEMNIFDDPVVKSTLQDLSYIHTTKPQYMNKDTIIFIYQALISYMQSKY